MPSHELCVFIFLCTCDEYISARTDRYNHDIGEDTDDTDESPLFGSFSSCSPQYRKVATRLGLFEELDDGSYRKSLSRTDSGQSDHSESSPSNVGSTLDTPETDGSREVREQTDTSSQKKIIQPSTPESSQTESDDVSPQIHRKRRLHSKEALPRFSISVEDNVNRYANITRYLLHWRIMFIYDAIFSQIFNLFLLNIFTKLIFVYPKYLMF